MTLVRSDQYVSDKIEVRGINIAYQAAGNGEPLLLLHGWGGSAQSFHPVFQDFGRLYLVVAPDLPGHGASCLPPSPWTVGDYADCVLEFMDKMGLHDTNVIAHSFGVRIAVKIAALHPDRIRRLVLVSGAGVPRPRSYKYYLRRGFNRVSKLLPKLMGEAGENLRKQIQARIGSKDYINAGPLRDTFVKIINEDLTPLLPNIKAPTLLVWGEKDTETPPAMASVFHRNIAGSQLLMFENAGHFPYLDQPTKFRLNVHRFLTDSDQRPPCHKS